MESTVHCTPIVGRRKLGVAPERKPDINDPKIARSDGETVAVVSVHTAKA